MPEIRACGFVLVREEGSRVQYLTLDSARHRDVGLPKGHAHDGEDDLDAAYRETEEETGIAPEDLEVVDRFRREVVYEVDGRDKRAIYFLARTDKEEVRLSKEHIAAHWGDLAETLGALRHDALREVVRDAATYLRDPALRRGLSPAAACELLVAFVGSDAPLVAHTAQVASMARTVAEAWKGVDADYVETAGWLHDIGRARTHGADHPLEGFRILVELGHRGYAPPCITHATKGASMNELMKDEGTDPEIIAEMSSSCDLEQLPDEERILALVDFLAVQHRRGTIDERRRDLEIRYGPSAFIARNARLAEALKKEIEEQIGKRLYPLLQIKE